MSSDLPLMGIGPDLDQEVSFHSRSEDSVQSRSERLVPSDGIHLGSVSANSIGLDSIGDPLADGLSDQDQQERGGEGLNLAAEMEILGPEFGSEDPIVNMDANGEEGRDGTIPKGRSIAHTIFNNQQSVFLSFDIETAGEIAGIVQISAEIVRFKINSAKKTVGSDYADDIERVADTFNSYVNPEVLPEYWDQRSISVHGIRPDDERIKNAGNMQTVWPKFQRWYWSIVLPSETVVLVAWNGEACDLKWLWRLTQAPNSRYSLPENIKFFIDPYRVIEKYKSCGFYKTKSKIEAYELGVVWKYDNNGTNLSGAHDSLVDVKAQTDILVHGSFVPFIDCSSSIQPINEIFSRTVQNEWRKELEPIRPVHAPWVELTNEHNIMWEPRWQDKYTGPQRTRDTIAAPRAQADYVANYNAVDRNDRDSADYSTTICTNRYYLKGRLYVSTSSVHIPSKAKTARQ
jgi:DNA polymerase III epsilon subunit-like protein